MSKSLWSRSVWNSLFNRVSGSRRLPKARRRLRKDDSKNAAISEVLEQRTVLAAVGVTFSGSTLTLVSTPGNTNEVVTVKAGAAFTDVLVKGQTTTRLQGVTSTSIATINFNGGGGTKDSLSVRGITSPLTVNLTDVDRLQLNSASVHVVSTISGNGTLTLVTSTIAGDLEVDHNGAINQSGKLLVSGKTDIDVTGFDITLKSSSNSFGDLVLDGDNINIGEAGPTNFGTTVATGNLTVTSSGAITNTAGTLTVGGVATLTSNGSTITLNGAFGDDIVLKKGTNITITDTNGDADLGKANATGSLTVTSMNGNINNAGNKLTVGGLATFTAHGGGTNDGNITLTGSNNFGSLSLNGKDVTVIEKSSTDLSTSTIKGDLSVTSSGAITDSGKLVVTGTLTLTTKRSPITLDRNDSTFGDLMMLIGTDISVRDNDTDAEIGASTANGNMTITSGGNVTQGSGNPTLTVSGRLTVNAAGGDVTLNSTNNRFGSISLFADGAVIVEANSTDLFTSVITGDFTLTSSGAITDSGVLTVGGEMTLTAAGNSITLDQEDSAFSDRINLTASNASIINSVASELGTVTISSNLTLRSAGNVTQTTATAINVTGRLTIDDDGSNIDVSLGAGAADGTIANFGSLSISVGGDVTITEDSGTDLFNSTIGGDLVLTSAGAVTDSGNVNVGGLLDITADITGTKQNITLNSTGSTFDDEIRLNGANVYLYNDNNTTIGTTTTTGTLTIVSAGDIVDLPLAVITTGGKATFDAQGDDITLNNANVFNNQSISLFGGNVTLNTQAVAQNIDLSTSTITGNLNLTVNGNITDSGTIRVDGIATIVASDGAGVPTFFDITLDSALNQFGTLRLTGDDAIINEFGDTDLGVSSVASLKVTSSGAITDSGVLTVTGLAELTASNGDLTLDSVGSNFGSLKLIGDNIAVQEASGTVLALVSTPGTFTLLSAGDVTQTGSLTVGGHAKITGLVITLAQDGDANLADDTIKNNFDSLEFTGTNVTIHESSDTELSPVLTQTSSASGTLTIKSLGSITANGVVTAGSTTDLTAGAAGTEVITLNNSSNAFGELRLKGGVVTITDSAGGTTIGLSTVGTLNLTTSGGNVTRTADALTVADQLSISAGMNDVDLRTGSGTNNFGSISITAKDVTITEASGTVIDFLDLAGDLDLISGGAVTDTDDTGASITIDDKTTINATGFDIDLAGTFGNGNDTDTVNLIGRDITLNSVGATTLYLGNITATAAGGAAGDLTITHAGGNVTNISNGGTDFGKLDVDGTAKINAGNQNVTINIAASESNLTNPLVVNTTGSITTTIPTASITAIDGVTGVDNNVNSAESDESTDVFNITGSVSGDLKAGDVVTLIVNMVTYTGVVDAGNTTFTVLNVKGQDLAADSDLTLDISITTAPRFGAYDLTVFATKTYTAVPGGA